jgi:methylated-DNA-[protein]-cysteine S-methyltransferase
LYEFNVWFTLGFMRYAVLNMPVGPLTLASTEKGLAEVRFGNCIPAGGIVDEQANREFARQLEQYFAGTRTAFDVPLDYSGTPFQLSVWEELMKIPYGQTRTYGELASRIGNPGAARAVGMANHENRIAVVIPCHRVVGRNGSLTGYAAGVHLKQKLLSIEQGPSLFT